MTLYRLLLSVFCIWCISPVLSLADAPLSSSKTVYLNQLIKRAHDQGLSNTRYWQILLHYKKGTFGGWESEADGPDFFQAIDGKINPKAELEATLGAFFSPDLPSEKAYFHPQCRFKARYDWLDEQLKFDGARLPPKPCERFQRWITDLNPESLSLVFPSYYLETPASMFGHTLLRINTKGNRFSSLLNYSINYAAHMDPERENAIAFAILGTFGGYAGGFSVVPYYTKIQEYNDIELRDIREYKLTFNRKEIRRMLKHLWELRFTYFDYFFFKENCSYHLLGLLEAARPTLRFQENFWLWTIPADTVREIIKVPGLVAERTYRPSRYSKIRHNLQEMTVGEQILFFQAVSNPEVIDTESWETLPLNSQAALLETLNNYYVVKGTPDLRNQRTSVLKKRARLKVVLPDVAWQEYSTLPESGHQTSRLGMTVGSDSSEMSFVDLYLEPSFHNLLSEDAGYFPNSEIEFLKIRLRAYEDETAVIEEFTLLSMWSLVAGNAIISPLSWRFRIGINRDPLLACQSCQVRSAEGGLGLSHGLGKGLFYYLAEAQLSYHREYEKGYQGGTGLRVGYIAPWGDRWKTNLSATRNYMTPGSQGMIDRFQIHVRYRILQDLDVRLEWDRNGDYSQTGMATNIYF